MKKKTKRMDFTKGHAIIVDKKARYIHNEMNEDMMDEYDKAAKLKKLGAMYKMKQDKKKKQK